jgi:MATE family multidrug resistance protein
MRLSYYSDFFKLSIPVILGQIGNVLMGITDMVMLGQVGKNELAAVGVANQIYFLFMVFGLGTMVAVTPMVAASKGADQKRECGELLRTGIELSFIISIALVIFLFLIIENFQIFHQPEEINVIAVKYLRMVNISTIPYLLFIALKQYSDGLQLTKPAMYITLAAVILNGLLNAIFIYGLFSFPPSGALGAGVATLFSKSFMALALVIYVFRNSIYNQFLPELISTFNTRPVIIKMLKIGLPSGLQMFLEISAFTATAVLIGWLGVNYLAAHQILLGILALIYTMAMGFSVAGSIKVAHSRGKEDVEGINFWSKFTFIIVAILLIIAATVMSIFNSEVIRLFVKEQEVVSIASTVFVLMAIFLVFDGIQTTGISLLRSLEDVKIPTYVTLISYLLIGLPLSYIFGFILHMDLPGIWLGLIVAGLISSGFLCIRYFTLLHKMKFKKYEGFNLRPNS